MLAAMRVRLATTDDALAIAEVHVRAWRGGYRGIMPAAVLDGLSVADRERTWRRLLSDEDNDIRTMVCEDGGRRVVGFLSITGASRDADAGAGVAEFPALYVDPASWRQGVGRTLVMAGLAALNAAGAREVTLWVLEDCAQARAFYERCGFTADGAAQDNEHGPRELRLKRMLGGDA